MITLNTLVSKVAEIITPDYTTSLDIITNIRSITSKYIADNNIKSLVLGISGGLDSAVVAAICTPSAIGIPLIGVSIPMNSTNSHKSQAKWVGDKYCTAFEEFEQWNKNVPMECSMYGSVEVPYYDQIFKTMEKTDSIAKKAGFNVTQFPKNILQGNMKARIRMMTLYDIARKTNGMVLSTDNLSEYLMGFWTICGDVGDYGPIQNLGKGFELPAIAKYLGIEDSIITQPPSDGLMVTEDNTDESQLGANYREVDTIMYIYLGLLPVSDVMKNKLKSDLFSAAEYEPKIGKIIKRYHDMNFKRIGTVNLTRDDILKK